MYGWTRHLTKVIPVVLTLIFLFFLYRFNAPAAKQNISRMVDVITEADAEKMKASEKENINLLMKYQAVLQLDDSQLPYIVTGGRNVYYLSQNMKTNGWAGFVTASGSKLSVSCIADEYAEKKKQAIADNHIFQLIISDGTSFQEADLIVTGTPVCEMRSVTDTGTTETDDEDGSSREIYQGIFTMFDGTGRNGEEYSVVSDPFQFHYRGSSSRIYDKKGYAVKLLNQKGKKKKENLLGLGESAKWKLVSMYDETSMVREKTAYTLWGEIADADPEMNESGAKYDYCELILNHQYAGVYGLAYPINDDTMKLTDGDIMYKVFSWDMAREKLVSAMEEGKSTSSDIAIKYPETADDWSEIWKPIFDYQEYGSWNPDVEKEAQGIKLDNQLDYYIFLQITEANDSMFKNSYFISRKSENGKMTMIPWDLNYSFGDVWSDDMPDVTYCYYPDITALYALDMQNNLLHANVLADGKVVRADSGQGSSVWNRVCQMYWKYRMDILSDAHITGLMYSNMKYLVDSGAFQRDTVRWPSSKDNRNLTKMMEYEKQRLHYLDGYFTMR